MIENFADTPKQHWTEYVTPEGLVAKGITDKVDPELSLAKNFLLNYGINDRIVGASNVDFVGISELLVAFKKFKVKDFTGVRLTNIDYIK